MDLFFSPCSYINQQTGECRIERYRADEPAWVEQVKICGNETGSQPLQTVAIMLRIEVNVLILVVLKAVYGSDFHVICCLNWFIRMGVNTS